eukprot:gene15979-biopygen8835
MGPRGNGSRMPDDISLPKSIQADTTEAQWTGMDFHRLPEPMNEMPNVPFPTRSQHSDPLSSNGGRRGDSRRGDARRADSRRSHGFPEYDSYFPYPLDVGRPG